MLRAKQEKMVKDLIWYYNRRTGSQLSSRMIVDSINGLLSKLPSLYERKFYVGNVIFDGDCYDYSGMYNEDVRRLKTDNDTLDNIICRDNEIAGLLMLRFGFYFCGYECFELIIWVDFKESAGEDCMTIFLNLFNYYEEDELHLFDSTEMEQAFDVKEQQLKDFIKLAITSKVREAKDNINMLEGVAERV